MKKIIISTELLDDHDELIKSVRYESNTLEKSQALVLIKHVIKTEGKKISRAKDAIEELQKLHDEIKETIESEEEPDEYRQTIEDLGEMINNQLIYGFCSRR